MHKLTLTTILLSLCLVGTAPHTHSSLEKVSYELVKVDSVIVNKLEPLQITDYNPKTKRYLAYGTRTKLCMELDANGKIIKEIDLSGEGPGHFGQGMSALGYVGDSKVIEGGASYIFLDKDWGYVNKYSPGSGMSPIGPLPYDILGILFNGKASIIKSVDHTYFGSKKLDNDHFLNGKMIEIFNGASSEPEQFLAYPENSLYRNNKTFYRSHRPRLSVNKTNQLLYLALPLEPKIYVFNPNNNFQLTKTIDLALDGFKSPDGIPFEDQHKNSRQGFGPANERLYVLSTTNSSILEINTYGETMIVVHKTGTKNSNYRDTQTANEAYKKQNKYFTSFIKNGKTVLSLEQRFNQMVRLDEHRFITPYISGEDEELDYNKFYIYELREVK